MQQTQEAILAEFPDQVIASHALIVARILACETVQPEEFLHLAGELLAVSKIARLLTRDADYIAEAKQCWREAAGAFSQCAGQWARLPNNVGAPVEVHRRLLQQLCAMATEEIELYSLSYCDRLRDRH